MKIALITLTICLSAYVNAQVVRDHRTGTQWKQLTGSDGKDVTIDSDGSMFLVNTAGMLYKYENNAWDHIKTQYEGYSIYTRNRGVWASFRNSDDGINQYIEKGRGKTYYGDVIIRGRVWKDLTIGADSTLWGITSDGKIYCLRYTFRWWDTPMKGSDGARISANAGQVWLVNTVGKIYRYKGSWKTAGKQNDPGWEQMPGANGRDITVTDDGNVFLVSTNGDIYRWTFNQWSKIEGSDGVRIAANAGKMLLVNTQGEIYYREY